MVRPWPTCAPRCAASVSSARRGIRDRRGRRSARHDPAAHRRAQRGAARPDGVRHRPLDTAEFDAATELAVRHFQQVRGLSVDGRVGEETYRALNEARWSLGDRLLRYDPERPIRGDDVINLQERLHELGYDAGPVDGVFGPETEVGLRTFQRDYGLTSDGTCGPATLRALRQLGRKVTGGRPAAAAAERVVRRERPAPDRPPDRRRPRPRRRGDRLHRGGDDRGRPGLRPRLPHRGPARRRRRHGLPHPRPGPEPLAGRAHGVRQRRPRRPVHLPAHGRAQLRARPRGGQLLLRHRLGGLVHGRRAVRQPGPPRGGRPHRHARPRLAPQDLGPAADDPHARRPAGLRLPLPPGRPAAAARRPGAQRHRLTPSWPPSSGSTCPPRPTPRPAPSCCPRRS